MSSQDSSEPPPTAPPPAKATPTPSASARAVCAPITESAPEFVPSSNEAEESPSIGRVRRRTRTRPEVSTATRGGGRIASRWRRTAARREGRARAPKSRQLKELPTVFAGTQSKLSQKFSL